MAAAWRSRALLPALAIATACARDPGPGDDEAVAVRPIEVTTSGAPRATPPRPPPPGACGFFELRNVVGQPYAPAVAEQARQASKAVTLRILDPGGPPPGPRDGDRLTLEVNGNQTITAAYCG